MNSIEPISLYFHIPFCAHRCAYCDFNTYAGQEQSIPAYVEALQKEIQIVGRSVPVNLPVHTIFFGGGTPSLLTAGQLGIILDSLHSSYTLSKDPEISLEANPGTCSREFLRDIRRLGFNRISFGVQSANPNELRLLERLHDYGDVVNAVKWSRQAGFDNLNIDLIYGLPGQTMADWQKSVDLILGLHPEHLSLYALTLEQGTPFGRWAERGLLPIPDADRVADMYEWVSERLPLYDFEQYEISNWSKPGRECRHNLQYWKNETYLGFGSGAHGYGAGNRYSNVLRIKTYINRLMTSGEEGYPFPLSPATVHQHLNSPRENMQETMMTGLRLTREGISFAEFHQRFNVDLREVFGREIEDLCDSDLLEWANAALPGERPDQRLRLSKRGRLLGNQVFMRFVGD